jgi:hypothetical protein
MLHQESSSRELVWIEGQNVEGWVALNALGCLTLLGRPLMNH